MGAVTLVDACANATLNGMAGTVNGGSVQIWTAGRTTLLATLTLGSPAFATASARSAALNTVTGNTAGAAGTAAVAVFRNSSAVEQFSGTVTATAGGGLVTFATLAWNIGDNINITGGSLSYPA
jgi:hypothetical protein